MLTWKAIKGGGAGMRILRVWGSISKESKRFFFFHNNMDDSHSSSSVSIVGKNITCILYCLFKKSVYVTDL